MGGGWRRWLLLLLILVVIILLARWRGCFGQPTNVLYVAPLPGASGTIQRIALPPMHRIPRTGSKPPAPVTAPDEKVHPLIDDWIASGRGGVRERFLVMWRDPIAVPMFPELDLSLPITAPVNDTAKAHSRRAVLHLEDLRRPIFAADTAGLGAALGMRGIESYWITQTMLVEMEVGQVPALATRPRVVYVMPDSTGEEPPAGCSTPNFDTGPFVSEARAALNTDLYRDAGYPEVWVSLLDTGVRTDHELLGSGVIVEAGDCVTGDEDCANGDPSDVEDKGHGTASAAILSGNRTWDERFRGVTDLSLHSFRVYKPRGTGATIVNSAVIKGLERGVEELDRVIVVETQIAAPATTIGAAADRAFAAGAVVVAANGNHGAAKLAAPSNARCVLGVGAYFLNDESTDSGQSYGTTTDGRVKPDLQAPSFTWTASNWATDTCWPHSQTSGATPYAAGAAALARGWLKHALGDEIVDPGQVMAFMIAATEERETMPDPVRGAGLLRLPTGGWAWFGKATFAASDLSEDGTLPVWDIPIDLTGRDVDELDAAVWWPEIPTSTKSNDNDIDLALLDKDGNVEESSENADGVYERVGTRITASEREPWTLRIVGYDLKHPPQDVYFVVVARPSGGGSAPPSPLN